ncbi:MAG: cysteine synthase family protein [Ruminococcus sp.]|nr:cysteine synthase family protein [Ruminococcus sp.]
MNENITKKFIELERLIGKTPLLAIDCLYKGEKRTVYAKYEAMQLSGSIKDRVAFYIMREAYKKGAVDENSIIVEATSGNTGIAFCAVGAYLGNKVQIFMPDWMSIERVNLMKSYGAEIRPVSREEGGFLGSIEMTEKLAEQDSRVFLPGQFSNEENCTAHYETTGREIAEQLEKLGKKADAVVAGVGTGGTIMGIGRRLRTVNSDCRLFPLEPLNSPTLSTGYKVGSHRIQGISDEFIPAIMKLDECDGVISVDDIDSIIMAQKLSRELGIGVGISSGANFLGVLSAGDKIGADKTIVTVFADDNKKYLSTDYCSDFEIKDEYMSKDIELLGVRTVSC